MGLDYFNIPGLKPPLSSKNLALKFDEFKLELISAEEFIALATSKAISHLSFIFSANELSMDIYDDAVSDTCLKIILTLNDPNKIQAIQNPSAYIGRLAYYTVQDILRAKTILPMIECNLDYLEANNFDMENLDIIDTVSELSKDDLDDAIIQLRLGNRTHIEVAQTLQIPRSTVNARLQKLKTKYLQVTQE